MTHKVISYFLDLVQISSPSGQENNVAQYVANNLKDSGLQHVSIDKVGNVIARIPGDTKKDALLLAAHLDTVEPGKNIQPVIDKDGYIRSAGNTILGADNKTAVAALLALVAEIKSSKTYHGHPLELVFTTSEESGNFGAHGLDYSQLKAKKGYLSDASNYSFGDIIIASPFYERFDIEIIGTSAHASQPEKAQNVTKALGEFLLKFNTGRVSDDTLCNIGITELGKVVNTIPGHARISGEIRSFREAELTQRISSIKQILNIVDKKHGVESVLKTCRENGGYIISNKNNEIKKALSLVRRFNANPQLIKSWGCYDANVFAEHGIQLINIADGSIDAHTTNERIHQSNLVNLVKLFKLLVE